MRRRTLGSAHELPEQVPPDEHVLWQGAPGWWPMARSLHIRPVAAYFAAALAYYLIDRLIQHPAGLLLGFARVGGLAAFALFLFAAYAFLVSRTASYTITTKRLILQVGVALPISFNLPFGHITAANLRRRADGSGDIVVSLAPGTRLSYAVLWPHVRAGRGAGVEPMLRAIPEVDRVARSLTKLLAESPQAALPPADRAALSEPSATSSGFGQTAVAA